MSKSLINDVRKLTEALENSYCDEELQENFCNEAFFGKSCSLESLPKCKQSLILAKESMF